MQRSALAVLLLSAAVVCSSPGRAETFTQMLSDATWPNGATGIGDGNFESDGAGPAPFDTLIGDKTNGPDPSISFSFSDYGGPISSTISSASLEIGLYDGASPTPASEVAFFTLNGVSIAAQLTALLVATPPVRNGEIYYTVDLPSTVFDALSTGTANFALGFTGQGEGLLGPSAYIAFGLDFATLTVTTSAAVPEPSSWAMLTLGFASLGFAGYRVSNKKVPLPA